MEPTTINSMLTTSLQAAADGVVDALKVTVPIALGLFATKWVIKQVVSYFKSLGSK